MRIMYKDKEAQKEASRERQRRYKERQKALLIEGVTEEGVTENITPIDRIEFIKQELNDPFLIDDIEGASKFFKDRDIRYERAYRYKLWRDTGQIYDTDTGTLAKLSQAISSLKNHKVLDGVSYGITPLEDIDRMLSKPSL